MLFRCIHPFKLQNDESDENDESFINIKLGTLWYMNDYEYGEVKNGIRTYVNLENEHISEDGNHMEVIAIHDLDIREFRRCFKEHTQC